MIILDTNVLSALMRRTQEPRVLAWMDAQRSGDVWITAISVLETRSGILRLPAGRRKTEMNASLGSLLTDVFGGRVLPFDAIAAEAAAEIVARRIAIGMNIETLDTQIAGIAVARNAVLATRNTRHFVDLGIALVDPWLA